jgi:DNA-binding GntR family transcriptional regulator
MVLSPERRARIRQRLESILKEYDADLQFVAVFVDSTREFLAVVAQLADRPVLLKFRWVDFISQHDASVRSEVFEQLEQKLGHSKRSPGEP